MAEVDPNPPLVAPNPLIEAVAAGDRVGGESVGD